MHDYFFKVNFSGLHALIRGCTFIFLAKKIGSTQLFRSAQLSISPIQVCIIIQVCPIFRFLYCSSAYQFSSACIQRSGIQVLSKRSAQLSKRAVQNSMVHNMLYEKLQLKVWGSLLKCFAGNFFNSGTWHIYLDLPIYLATVFCPPCTTI